MVEALGITIDRRPKGRPRKRGSQIIEKIGCAPILNKEDYSQKVDTDSGRGLMKGGKIKK